MFVLFQRVALWPFYAFLFISNFGLLYMNSVFGLGFFVKLMCLDRFEWYQNPKEESD